MTRLTLRMAGILLLLNSSGFAQQEQRTHDVTLSDGMEIEVTVEADVSQVAPEWLLGSWRMRYDPDGAEPDTLVFTPDNTGFVIRPDGGRFPYGYKIVDNAVMLVFTVNERTAEIPMHISHEQGRLTNDTGAWYTPE